MKILFDETQKERGRIYTNFSILESDLENRDHKIAVLDTFPIKYSSINSADMLVFLCPDGSKLYGHEVKALLRYVDEGGIIAIFGNAGGDKGLNTNLNTLLKHFNMELVQNQIFDYQNFDYEMETCIKLDKLFPHPITEDVEELLYVSGCSLHIESDVIEIARTKNTSEPPSSTIMGLYKYGEGKVFVCGSYLMFSDKKIGITNKDNRTLINNLFNWAETQIETEEEIVKLDIEIPDEIDEKQESDNIEGEGESETQVSKEKTQIKSISATDLSEREVEEAIKIIEEIKQEIDRLPIDDPGYKEILLTDIARKRGIDYAQIHTIIEEREDKKQQKGSVESEPSFTELKVKKRPSFTDLIEEADNFEKVNEIPVMGRRDMEETQKTSETIASAEIQTLIKEVKMVKETMVIINDNLTKFFSKILKEIQELKNK